MNPSTVWYCFPTANIHNANNVAMKWTAQGYKIAMFVDESPPCSLLADHLLVSPWGKDKWPGYYAATNLLLREPCIACADVVVVGGDDMHPDPVPAQLIREQFLEKFPDTLGVMQPVGDPFPSPNGVVGICGSPWLGRQARERLYGGLGPFPEHYFHFFGDQELWDVSARLGILWPRRDLAHYHDHWSRRGNDRPQYLHRAQQGWDTDKAKYNDRAQCGYPGHDLKRV